MNKRDWIVWIFVLVTGFSLAQKPGYYGKRFFIEVDGQGQIPVLQMIFGEDKGYVARKGELKKSFNWVDIAYRGSLNYVTGKKTAFGIEFSQRFYQFNPQSILEITRDYRDEYENLISEYLPAQISFFNIQETNLMPRLLISVHDAQLPCGFVSEMGVGYSTIKVSAKGVGVVLPQELEELQPLVLDQLLDPEGIRFNGVNAMFGCRMNFPIAKRLLIHVGFRYQYAWIFGKKKYRSMNESVYWFSPREMWTKVNMRRQMGVFSFGAGLTFSF